jgi:hypothetical protein
MLRKANCVGIGRGTKEICGVPTVRIHLPPAASLVRTGLPPYAAKSGAWRDEPVIDAGENACRPACRVSAGREEATRSRQCWTNARASGFGLCQAAGRVGAFVAIPSFLWIQQGLGLTAVFVVIAVIVVIAAVAVTQIGPEAKGLALDEIAPPTA